MSQEPNSRQGLSTFTGCFVRLFWMGAGNLLLLMFAVLIAQKETFDVSVYDLGLWVIVAAMVCVRYVDITRLGGQTTEGQPATVAHWRSYSLGLASVAFLMWIVAHALAATRFFK